MDIKVKLLLKGLIKSIKYSVPVIVTLAFCCGILMIVLSNNYSDKMNEIDSVIDVYGDYHFYMPVDDTQINYLNTCEDVKDVYYLNNVTTYIKGGGQCTVIDVSKETLKNTQYRLIEGRLPDNENEIIAPRWYLYKLGINRDKMLGSDIEVPFDDDKVKKGTVVGIIDDIPSGTTSSVNCGEAVFGTKLNKEYSFEAYVRLKDINKVYDFVESLKEQQSESDADDIYEQISSVKYNYNLLDAMRVSEESKEEENRQTKLFFAVEILVMIVGGITILQVTRMFFMNIKDDLIIFRIIGVHDGMLTAFICIIFLIFIILGVLLGSLGAYIGLRCFYDYLGNNLYVPWNKYIYIAFINIAISLLFVLIKTSNMFIREFDLAQLGQSAEGFSVNNILKREFLFEDSLFKRWKLIRRNCALNIIKKILTCMVGIIAVVMVSMVFCQVKEQLKYDDDNYEYKYRIEIENDVMADEWEQTDKIFKDIRKCIESYDCDYYIGEYTWASQDFKKNELDDKMIEILSRNAIQAGYINNKYSDELDVTIYVMGYSKEMLEELCRKNNIDMPGEYEAIVLDRSVNRDNTFSGNLNLNPNRKFGFSILYIGKWLESDKVKYKKEHPDEYTHVDFDIIGEVDELPVYPEDLGNYPVMIIDEDTYEYCFKDLFPVEYIYIEDENEELIDEIASIGMGTDRVYIVDQEDEIRDVNKGYVKKILGYVFVAIFTGIFAIFNSIITTRMEYELRRKDLTVYRLLGISRFTMLFIQLMEVIVLDAASIAVGVYAAKRLIEYLTLKEILYMTAITQKEIAAMVAFGAVLMLSKIICITLNYHRDERKNVIC